MILKPCFLSYVCCIMLTCAFGTNAQGQVMPTPQPVAGVTSSPQDLAAPASKSSNDVQASLTQADVQKILDQAEASSSRTVSLSGLRTTTATQRACRHHIFVVDRNGKVLGRRSMPDAWVGSVDIALGKARTAVFFSSNENALSSRQVGELSQAHGPDGTGPAGPLWGIGNTNRSSTKELGPIQTNSIVTFPGGLPLYKQGKLVGGIGVSGDGVDQDESVAYGGAKGFMPDPSVGTVTPLRPKAVDWFPPK
jgi:uncharacterized protein GlcG (DUF336 family)